MVEFLGGDCLLLVGAGICRRYAMETMEMKEFLIAFFRHWYNTACHIKPIYDPADIKALVKVLENGGAKSAGG